jgi:hypothetical protein
MRCSQPGLAASVPLSRITSSVPARLRWSLDVMKRRLLLLSVPLSVVILSGWLLPSRLPSAPRLWLLGFTNAPGSNATAAVLCLKNLTGHRVYLSGPTNRVTFFSREVATPTGWAPAEAPSPVKMEYSWDLSPAEEFVFFVPAITNQQAAWRVAVRYFDGAAYTQIPVLYRILPGGGPTFRVPWKGSGQYHTITTSTLTNALGIQQVGPANRSQPVRPETNPSSAAAGPGR